MWICHCNPFDDKAVKSCLEDNKGNVTSVGTVYKQCSGGKKPGCGRCAEHLKPMIMAHNRDATVEGLRRTVEKEKNPASPTPCMQENADA